MSCFGGRLGAAVGRGVNVRRLLGRFFGCAVGRRRCVTFDALGRRVCGRVLSCFRSTAMRVGGRLGKRLRLGGTVSWSSVTFSCYFGASGASCS